MASAAKTTLSLLWLVATIIGSTAFVPLTRHAVAVTRPLASSARSRTAPMHMGLLKGLDPILTAELLFVLRSAGHGDVIAVVDCNFPAVEVASKTTTGTLVTLAGVDCPDALSAIGSVMPIDLFVDEPLRNMCPSPGLELPPAGVEVLDLSSKAMAGHCTTAKFTPLDRMAFYDEARKAFAVVQCSERRPYGCFLLQKGVVGPDGKDLQP